MKNLSFPQLLFAGLGALLIWAAITGKSPAQIVKESMSAPPDKPKTNITGIFGTAANIATQGQEGAK